MATETATPPLKKGDRVRALEAFRGVPEGTAGKVKVVDGLGPWIRTWVEFDNGIWLGSISVSKLVRERDWDEFQQRRAAEAEAAAERAARAASEPEPAAEEAAAPAAAPAAGGDAAASKVPAALLARSQAAKARKAAAAKAEEG